MNAHRKDTMKKETSAAAVDEEWDRRLRHGRDRTPRRIDETLGRASAAVPPQRRGFSVG